MADYGNAGYAVADGNDYAEHERTYAMFVAMVKGGLALVVAVLVLMAIFLV